MHLIYTKTSVWIFSDRRFIYGAHDSEASVRSLVGCYTRKKGRNLNIDGVNQNCTPITDFDLASPNPLLLLEQRPPKLSDRVHTAAPRGVYSYTTIIRLQFYVLYLL